MDGKQQGKTIGRREHKQSGNQKHEGKTNAKIESSHNKHILNVVLLLTGTAVVSLKT